MNRTKQIIKLSRPRFWLYLAGPYLVGMAYSAQTAKQFYSFDFLYPLFYFLIPANMFLYGINDLFDKDTDKLNAKKISKEIRVTKRNDILYRVQYRG